MWSRRAAVESASPVLSVWFIEDDCMYWPLHVTKLSMLQNHTDNFISRLFLVYITRGIGGMQ